MPDDCGPMVEVQVVGEVGPAELADLGELLAVAEATDGHAPIGEHHWLDLVRRNLSCYWGLIARDPPHPHPVGYGHLSCDPSSDPRQWALEIAVDPAHRGVGVEVALVASARKAAEDAGGGLLRLWVYRPTEMHDALAHRFNLKRERDLLQQRRPLPHPELPSWPSEVHVRAFRVGQDEAQLVKVNNAAFEGHPEQGRWDEEVLAQRRQEPWFDPAGFLVAEDGRGLAGFCWTKIHHRGGLGEIYVVGVDPSRQGAGLGRALVLAGLDYLARRGLPVGMLYVDAASGPALRLYKSLGFEVHHLDRAYSTVLSGGPSP